MDIKKIGGRLGFTNTEFKIILFLCSVFFVGLLLKLMFAEKVSFEKFDYSYQDSLFQNAGVFDSNLVENELNAGVKNKIKAEILDFDSKNFSAQKKKEVPAENSINLNTAGTDDLIKLPGIGEKIAARIVEFRKQIGVFKSIEQLKEVKGIQDSKLDKIRKYLILK